MLTLKTHFEQVSLTIVRKMVEQQLRREIAINQNQEAEKKLLEEDHLQSPGRSMAGQCPVSTEEL